MPTYSRGCWVLARTVVCVTETLAQSSNSFQHGCSNALGGIQIPRTQEEQKHQEREEKEKKRLTTGVPNDTYGEARRHPAQPDADSGAELEEALVQGHVLVEVAGDDDGRDEPVDGEDLGHDGAERVLHEPVGPQDARREYGAAGLCGAVRGAEDGEDHGRSAAHCAEEGLFLSC